MAVFSTGFWGLSIKEFAPQSNMNHVFERMKHRKTFRGAFQRKLTKFGDLVTFDYVDNRQVYEQDSGVEKTIFVIRDRYTGVIQAYPSARKDADAVIRAVKQFMGRRKIREVYSDQAPQLTEAMKALKIPCDHSLAGKTKHNPLAERNNQLLLVATTYYMYVGSWNTPLLLEVCQKMC